MADFTVSWVFHKYFNFVPMLESHNVDHMKGNCSWDMFLWIKSSGLHTFMSFSNIFLYPCYNHELRITWKVIVREICFCEYIQADFSVSWVYQKYFNFVHMLESCNLEHMKANCSWDMFLWKNSSGLHTFMTFSKIFQLCTHARITYCGSRER